MSSSGSVTKLISRVKHGDAAAAQELLARYFRRLLGLARAKLRGKCLAAADEEDVVQSALVGFFLGAQRGQYTQLHDRDDLWHLLVTITIRKAQKLVKQQAAKKRLKPESEDTLPGEPIVEQIVDPNPPPDLEVSANEAVQHLLKRLGDPQLQSIAVWKWEGYTNEEIAAMLGCSPKAIERKLKLIRTIWGEEEAL